MKYALSILAHEKPDVVVDQIRNIAHFVPDATIVLHLHVNFDWGGAKINFSEFDNVLVNPASTPTFWGNLHHAHHLNFHFASRELEFTHFLIHSSSDLFVREGVAGYIDKHEAGLSLVSPMPSNNTPMFAEGDPVFQKIMSEAGSKELWCSQIEGTFYKKELFAELVARIERHFDYRNTLPYVHEEIYYPTIMSGLGIEFGDPYLLREDKENLPTFNPALVDMIRNGEVSDYHIVRWKLGREVDSTVWHGENMYAMRPIPRVIDHPIRQHVRSIMEAA